MIKIKVERTNVDVVNNYDFDNIEEFLISDALLASDATMDDMISLWNRMLELMGYPLIALLPDDTQENETMQGKKIKVLKNDHKA